VFSNVTADGYDAFMGRFSEHLPDQMIALAEVAPGERALDVGCGPGALTGPLATLLGPASVVAVDPTPAFVAAAQQRFPGVEVLESSAENLPFADDAFDVALAQLVVHFMADPLAGLTEMTRVTRPGGRVVACVWDHQSRGPLSTFVGVLDVVAPYERRDPPAAGTTPGNLEKLFALAGLHEIQGAEMSSTVTFSTFEEWLAPYRLKMGSLATRLEALTASQWRELEDLCRQELPTEPFQVTGTAWAAVGTA
jgi:SAM-dependent methyltransferase